MSRRWIVPISLAGAALVGWIFLRGLIGEARLRSLSGDPAATVVAIQPFDVRRPGDASLRSVHLLLALDLESVDDLRVIEIDPGSDANSDGEPGFLIVGSGEVRGDSLVLAVDVHDRLGGGVVSRAEVRGHRRELAASVDRLAEAVVAATLPDGAAGRPPCLACVTSRSRVALVSYLAGEARYRAGDLAGAARELGSAVRADSSFALAWLRLADVAEWTEEPREDLAVAAATADRLSDRLPARHAELARARYDLSLARPGGVKALEAASRRWQNDPDVWALLGSTLYLVGSAGVARVEQAEEALARASALRPSFAPTYARRVDLALASFDSVRATALLDTLESRAPGAWFTLDRRVRWTLAFGDSRARRVALRALDGRPEAALAIAREALPHPGHRVIRRQVLDVALAGERRSEAIAILAWGEALDSRPEAALRALEDPGLDPAPRLGILYAIRSRGFEVPPDRIDEAARAALAEVDRPTDPTEGARLFFAAVWSLERGQEDEGRGALARFRRGARHASDAGDSSLPFAVAAARGIEGYDARRRGEDEDAIRRLEGALGEIGALGGEALVNAQIRWWLAELHERRGHPHQALAYYDSFWWDPIAARRAAAIRDRMESAGSSTDRS